jgi:hypothetical protein
VPVSLVSSEPVINVQETVVENPDPFAGVIGVTPPPVPKPTSTEEVVAPEVPDAAASENGRVSYADAAVSEIDITKIIPNPYQPRKVFKPEALQELSDYIKEHGVIQPLVVTKTANGYEIVVGERRFRANFLFVEYISFYLTLSSLSHNVRRREITRHIDNSATDIAVKKAQILCSFHRTKSPTKMGL